jgi:RimJ/RimL family protein N-acetyltransferase
MMNISLRNPTKEDLNLFFDFQADNEALFMSAFTSKDPFDRDAYLKKWERLMTLDSVNIQAIVVDNEIVGCVVKFVMGGDSDITYALNKKHWGKGITSEAASQFLKIEKSRPLYGRTAFDNFASQKILEKNGFLRIGDNIEYANARGENIKEYIYRLD